jgi:triosephosphate isomerase
MLLLRIPLIAGNWKMNTTVTEAVKLVNDMKTASIRLPESRNWFARRLFPWQRSLKY